MELRRNDGGNEMTHKQKTMFFNVVKIALGSFIFAVGVNMFALSNNLGEGGVTGITMLLYYSNGWSPALTNVIFNFFLMLIGYKYLDKITMYYTILAIALMSLFLNYTDHWIFQSDQTIVAAVTAGTLLGVGMGLIMKGNGTTAGTAILAKLANKYLGWNTSYALLFFDFFIVIASVWVIGLESMLFTFISLAVSTKVLDFILEGSNPKKSVVIISESHELIAEQVSQKLDRGITIVNGTGYYQKDPKQILYIVVSRQQLLPLQKIIMENDPNAFVIINDAQSVIGEGFTRQLFDQ